VVGLTLRQLAERGIRVSVVAIKRGGSPLLLNPGPEEEFQRGDLVIVVGDSDNLARLAKLAAANPAD
jgi:K+/H+ antiporter YhaU regulatory subunit KhtT